MRKPNVSKPRAAAAIFTLSRRLPPLRLPTSAVAVPARGKPQVHAPGRALFASLSSAPGGAPPSNVAPPSAPLEEAAAPIEAERAPDACRRCGHDESEHPVRYVCDKYPHPDPLQICGCAAKTLEQQCPNCGHSARSHKARHRCKSPGCGCWGYDTPEE